MAINNRKSDVGSGFGVDRGMDRLERRMVRDAFGPQKSDLQAQDKALTDSFNKLFGADISYGTDGYEAAQNASPTPYTKPTNQDKALTKILNNEFGGHVSFATDKHNNRKEDRKLTDTLNGTFGGDLGYTVSDPGSAADQDKALTDAMNGLLGTKVGYTSPSTAPSSSDLQAQDESLTETINRLLGTSLK